VQHSREIALSVLDKRLQIKKYHSTILIVDDDPNDLDLIEAAFRANGVMDPIQKAQGGQEAIDYMMGTGKYADRAKYAYQLSLRST
jgi:hypothetical protein